MTAWVPKLLDGLTRSPVMTDLERHWQSLLDCDEPQAVVK
jgi:hypothetical protein